MSRGIALNLILVINYFFLYCYASPVLDPICNPTSEFDANLPAPITNCQNVSFFQPLLYLLLGQTSASATTPGIELTQSGSSTNVTEAGGTDTYTIVLMSAPNSAVSIEASGGTQLLLNGLSTATLTFDTNCPGSNCWSTMQTLTVSAVNDDLEEGIHNQSISHTVSSNDTGYDKYAISPVSVSIQDDDTAGVTITESGGSTSVSEVGGTDNYTVVLTSQPTSSVTVTVTADAQIRVNGGAIATLTFTTDNWNTIQTVTVSAVDDALVEGAHNGTISHSASSSDTNYNSIGIASVTTAISDNDFLDNTWIQDAYLKASNSEANDRFGISVSISGDHAIVGATLEDNSSTAIYNTDNAVFTDAGTANAAGAAYIYKRDAGTGNWIQDAYLKASNAGFGDTFGDAVSISGDYAIVGSLAEDNSSTTINNTDNAVFTDTGNAGAAGAAYIYKRDTGTGDWIQDAYLKASNAGFSDTFGDSVLISGDYAIVGAHLEDNGSTTVNNTDNVPISDSGTATDSGAVYIFKRDTVTGNWIQDAYLKASNAETLDQFGYSVSISGDYAIVGANLEDNNSTTINNTDNAPISDTGTATDSGVVYIFKRDTGTGNWIQDAYLKASNAGASDNFGYTVSISGDYAIVGAHFEDNSSTAINNTDNAVITDAGTATDSGAVYIFKRDTGTGDWIQDAYLKASNAGASDNFGYTVSISGDYAIVGATLEDNSSKAINNTDNAVVTDAGTAGAAGAVYIYKRDSGTSNWIQDAYLKASNAGASDNFGYTVSISGDYAIVGANYEDNSSTVINNTDNAPISDTGTATNSGAAYIFKRL